jgi:phosphoglycolate phosphatase-like HAD superfamily hydrolase
MNYFFDLDGVLVDAKEWHYESLNLALKSVGVEEISKFEHTNIFDGWPTKKKLEYLSKNKNLGSFKMK